MSSTIKPKDAHYLRYRKEIEEAYESSKDWNEVIGTVVYADDELSMEAFIDYLEEMYSTKVKDVKHLKELTGCKEYADEDKMQLQDVLIAARYSKYFKAIETALQEGATYTDLLKMEPKEYGLPKSWDSRRLGRDKQSSILWAINFAYSLDEPSVNRPNLRDVAKDLQAPYSVIMDSYTVEQRWR